jgi:hypothetical protein
MPYDTPSQAYGTLRYYAKTPKDLHIHSFGVWL